MTHQEFFNQIHPVLFWPAAKVWDDAMDKVIPERREEIEGLVAVGQPTVLVRLDTDWEIPGPAEIVIVITHPREPDTIAMLGTSELTETYRRALLDLCRIALGDLNKRQGEIHRQHQAGDIVLTFAADIRRRTIRLSSHLVETRTEIGLVEICDPEPSVVN